LFLRVEKKKSKEENNPNYGKTLSCLRQERWKKKKISDALVGNTNKKGKPRAEGAGKPSQQIEVTDIKNNITTTYISIGEAARALNLPSYIVIYNYIKNNQKKPYKGIYTFKKVN